jgi:NAD(P)-dependent dehydrogenase (short-subunit alcohol dehydrogenase family)
MKRVALITGAGRGIGRSTVDQFHRNGWIVIGVDRHIRKSGRETDRWIKADLADVSAPERLLSEVRSVEGRLDALINNAAIQICKPLTRTGPQEWDSIVAVNVRAPFLLMKAFHPLLKKSRGAIVNVASVHALATSENIGAYAATKGALLSLSRAAALEFARDHIRVNAILPGAIDTPMLRAGLTRGFSGTLADLAKRHPIGRVGCPDDIAEAIFFLSDNSKAGFITGQSIVVDGGAVARLSTE